jgi:hypothetical protein
MADGEGVIQPVKFLITARAEIFTASQRDRMRNITGTPYILLDLGLKLS